MIDELMASHVVTLIRIDMLENALIVRTCMSVSSPKLVEMATIIEKMHLSVS
jgi:hypothetical protein